MRTATICIIAIFMVGLAIAQTDTLYFEGFEGSIDWEVGDMYWYGDTLIYWHTDTFGSYDGESFWCGTMDVGGTGYNGYNDGWLQYMDTPGISLPASPAADIYFTFKQKFHCEPAAGLPEDYPFGYNGWDGADIWISTDEGVTWDVIDPATPAYDVTSLWGFGFCGLGPNYPAWAGSSGVAFEPANFDLTSYAGTEVILRFVFCSDMMFSTGPTHSDDSYNENMFGWIVDDIAVTDSTDTLFSTTGELAGLNFSQGRVLNTWELTDETAASGSYSMMTKAYCESYATLISPIFTIPDTFAGKLYLDVKLEFVDSDPDSDNNLDDYFTVAIIDSTVIIDSTMDTTIIDTTIQIMYNYYRPGYIDSTWSTFDDADLFGVMTNSLRDFAGHDVRIMILGRGDGLPDTTQHLYVDNVVVAGYYALLHDIAPTLVAAGPLSAGERGRFTVQIANEGMEFESMIQVNGLISYPVGSDSAVTFWPRPSIEGGEKSTVFKEINSMLPGVYTIRAWTSLGTDLDLANDTIEASFTIPDYGTMELGWDDGVNDVVSDDVSVTTLYGFLGTGLLSGEQLGNRFKTSEELTDIDLTSVKFFTTYNGTVSINVLGHVAGLPNGGAVLYNDDHVVTSDSINGSWVTIDLSSEDIAIPDSVFFVFVGTVVDSQVPMIGIDATSPLERWGWAIYNSGAVMDTLFLREGATAPYNAIDLMIRAFITGTHGISDDGGSLPREVALHDNYPNPFNPATSISFELPSDLNAELTIYNLLGGKVTTLVDENMKAGSHKITWTGRDDNGRTVPSGVYLYRLSAGDRDITKRMVLIK